MSAATDAAKANLSAFQALDSGKAIETAESKYDVAGSRNRLSALKGIVSNLQSSVEAVDPSVTGRTSGTFTTEGQRQALVAKERQPILGELGKQQGALTSEQGDLTTKQTLASQMASALLSDDKAKYQRLLDSYNAEVARDAAEEQRRQYEASLAEQRRQADLNAQLDRERTATSRSSGGGGSSTPTVSQFLVQAFSGYEPSKMKNYTEREIIPALMANFNLSKEQAARYAYQYRKSVYNE